MARFSRLVLAMCFVLCQPIFGASIALGDDCGSPDDCKSAPGNINAATGIGAGVATIVVTHAILRRRKESDTAADEEAEDYDDLVDQDLLESVGSDAITVENLDEILDLDRAEREAEGQAEEANWEETRRRDSRQKGRSADNRGGLGIVARKDPGSQRLETPVSADWGVDVRVRAARDQGEQTIEAESPIVTDEEVDDE